MRIGIIVFASGVVTSGCSSKVCTAVGCYDNFSASVRSADGSFPSGMHRIELLVDGVTIICTFTFPLETVSGGGTLQPACPTGLMVNISPAQTCMDVTFDGGVVGHRCDPIPGQFVETISLLGTPGQVHAWQYVDDIPILDAALAPSYQENRPNGPECEPLCRQASASWTLM